MKTGTNPYTWPY